MVASIEKHWYQTNSKPPWYLRLGSSVFSTLTTLRKYAYKRNWIASYRPPLTVIVVGNITVGGTGKTPLVVWLVHFLKNRGINVGVISRGYGGQSDKWPMPVYEASDPHLVGDEPVLISQRAGCPVWVGPNRKQAIEAMLLQHPELDCIVSDDGLQHYALQRDVEIAVIDGERRLGNEALLPAGPLREKPERLSEVDFVVCNGKTARESEFEMLLDGGIAVNLSTAESLPLSRFKQVNALAGIGNPERFFNHLKHNQLSVHSRVFPDHHKLQPNDIAFDNLNPVLMTEKDAVKCLSFAKQDCWYVPVSAIMSQAFEDALAQRLASLLTLKEN